MMRTDKLLKSRAMWVLACAIIAFCAACSREQDELYQDPYADPDVKVGQQSSEQFEPADKHEGRYSVYSYEFKGKGPAHKMSEVRKYGLDHTGSRGSDVSVKVYIEWPEEGVGLLQMRAAGKDGRQVVALLQSMVV